MRSFSPSRIRVCTSTVSPILNSGSSVLRWGFSTWASTCWLMVIGPFLSYVILSVSRLTCFNGEETRELDGCSPWFLRFVILLSFPRPQQTLLLAPTGDFGVISAHEHLRHLVAAEFSRPRVLCSF